MAKRYIAEEVTNLITNDNDGEMDSVNSFDEEFSSDAEPSSESEIDSCNDDPVSLSGPQVLDNRMVKQNSLWGRPSKRARTTGGRGWQSTISRRRTIITHGSSRTIPLQDLNQNLMQQSDDDAPLVVGNNMDASSEPDREHRACDDSKDDDSSDDQIKNPVADQWSTIDPTIKEFQVDGINVAIPNDYNPLFFFKLLMKN